MSDSDEPRPQDVPPLQTDQGRSIEPLSRSGKTHHQSSTDTLNLFFFLFGSLAKMDKLAQSIVQANPELAGDFQPDPNYPTLGPYGLTLKKYSQPFLRMLVCQLVDNFSTYLSEVMREVLHAKPELLRSAEQVRVDYVLQFSSVEELTADLIDRKVADLSYRGFTELDKWFSEKLGLPLVDTEVSRANLIEVIETRNVFVHNRGIIGEKYCRNVTNSSLSLGQIRTIDLDYLIHAFEVLLGCGHSLDEKLGAKFSLGDADSSAA